MHENLIHKTPYSSESINLCPHWKRSMAAHRKPFRVTWVQEVTLRWAIDKTSIERAVYQWSAYDGPPVNTLDGYPGNQSLVASNQTSASKWYLVGTAVVWSSNSWILGFPLSAHAPQVWKILSDSALTHCKDLCISSRHKSQDLIRKNC